MAIVRKASQMSANRNIRKPETVFGGFNKTRIERLGIKRNLDQLTDSDEIWIL